MRTDLFSSGRVATVLLLMTAVPSQALAQNRVGGHFGVLVPLLTRAQGTTVTVADDLVIGFPTGITVKTSDKVAFDLELVPIIQNDPLEVSLTVHPGVIYSVSDRLATGVRMAFDVNAASWGFTPLVNRRIVVNRSSAVFLEVVAPLRFQQDFKGEHVISIGLGMHVGVGFE